MTIKDIARESGYAVSTVSRALNGHPDVSPIARAKIMAVVEARHFSPNNNAKHLKQASSSGVAVVVKGTRNMLFAGMVEQVQTRIEDGGYAAAVYYQDEDADEVEQARQICRERNPLGILFLGGDLDNFRAGFAQVGLPCVLVTNSAAALEFPNLSSVTTDDASAAACAVEYLMERGHRSIGILGGNLACSQISYRRLTGCEDAFRRRGVPFDRARQYESARFSMPMAYEATLRLLDRSPELTALFAMSDVMAIGALRALRDRGRRVPEDISVMGYDGIELGRFCVPRLSTVRQDAERLALRGVEILLRQLEQGGQAVHELAPFRLVAGESVDEPKQHGRADAT